MDVEQRRRISFRVAVVLAVMALLAIAIYSIVTLVGRIGKAKVRVVYAPYASTVKIDGNKISNNATHWLAPGKYHITVEYENFSTIDQEVEVPNDGTTLYGQLSPLNDVGLKYAREHNREFAVIEGFASKKDSEYGSQLHERFPLLKKLPIKDPHYALSYELSGNNTQFKIIIKASLSYRSLAISKLMTVISAKDIEKYDVEVKEIDSPFTGNFVQNNEMSPFKYLQKGFGNAMNGFSFGNGKEESGYYYGYIRRNVGYVGDVYRFILKKEGSSWQLCGKPYPVLTSINTNGAPADLLFKADTDNYK